MFTDRKNATQIMKVHSKGAFCEVMSSSFPIRKVQMNFISYNANNKVTNSISVYIDIEKFLPLINSVRSGEFINQFMRAKQTGTFKGQPVSQYTSYFTDQGGTNRDGQVLSRVFKIQESRKAGSWNLYAAEGPGKTTGNGLIQMNGKPNSFINIPITHSQLVTMMMKVEMHLQAYTNLIMSKFAERIFTGVFSGDPEKEYTSYFYEKDKHGNTGGSQGNMQGQYQQNQNQGQGQYQQPQYHQPQYQGQQNQPQYQGQQGQYQGQGQQNQQPQQNQYQNQGQQNQQPPQMEYYEQDFGPNNF